KSEVGDAARVSGVGGVGAFEDDRIARARCLHLDEAVLAVDLDRAEHLAVEARCAIEIADRKRDMCEAVRTNHGRANRSYYVANGMAFDLPPGDGSGAGLADDTGRNRTGAVDRPGI